MMQPPLCATRPNPPHRASIRWARSVAAVSCDDPGELQLPGDGEGNGAEIKLVLLGATRARRLIGELAEREGNGCFEAIIVRRSWHGANDGAGTKSEQSRAVFAGGAQTSQPP
jgi:hypothetical protein